MLPHRPLEPKARTETITIDGMDEARCVCVGGILV